MSKNIFNFSRLFFLPIILIMIVLCSLSVSTFAQENKEEKKQNTRDTLILEKDKTTYRFDEVIKYSTTDFDSTFNDFIRKEANFSPFLVDSRKAVLPSDKASWFRIPVKSNYDEISDWFLQVRNGYQMKLYVPQLDGSYREERFGLFYKDSL